MRINRANLECESCAATYLRGLFLSCGVVTDPSSDYHLEFSVPYYNLSRDLTVLLAECGLRAKLGRLPYRLFQGERTDRGLPDPDWGDQRVA